MADSTLTAIRTKVRRLTKSPSVAQISDAQIDEYVNTFILYDFPEHLRLFALHSTLTFYTQPGIDTYSTNTTNVNDPLFNFKNKYISINNPVYISGYKAMFTQSREQFFNIYPFLNSIQTQTLGDGATTAFTGNLSLGALPVLRNNVVFTSVDAAGNALTMIDLPVNPFSGNLYPQNGPLPSATVIDPTNTINYITGAFTVTFTAAPASGVNVNSETVPYIASIPQSMLYYDDIFTLRPVPNSSYPVNIEVYARPTELLQAGSTPKLEQWWQYIAYGASKKVLEDRIDTETLTLILPEYKKQELLVLRTTIVQNTNERTATIYTEQSNMYGGPWGWFGQNN
jgi:hypothetical protein